MYSTAHFIVSSRRKWSANQRASNHFLSQQPVPSQFSQFTDKAGVTGVASIRHTIVLQTLAQALAGLLAVCSQAADAWTLGYAVTP